MREKTHGLSLTFILMRCSPPPRAHENDVALRQEVAECSQRRVRAFCAAQSVQAKMAQHGVRMRTALLAAARAAGRPARAQRRALQTPTFDRCARRL